MLDHLRETSPSHLQASLTIPVHVALYQIPVLFPKVLGSHHGPILSLVAFKHQEAKVSICTKLALSFSGEGALAGLHAQYV